MREDMAEGVVAHFVYVLQSLRTGRGDALEKCDKVFWRAHLEDTPVRQVACKHGEIVEPNVVETGGTTEDHVIMIGGHRPFSWVGPARPHWHHAGAAMASRRLCWPSRGHVCAILCDLGAIKMSFSSARNAYF